VRKSRGGGRTGWRKSAGKKNTQKKGGGGDLGQKHRGGRKGPFFRNVEIVGRNCTKTTWPNRGLQEEMEDILDKGSGSIAKGGNEREKKV